ncbi:hypothetical protein F4808DRAFT_386595 [Astrocystis sublimbata]|nr:hypothetical protein F4808DRAFT_386595 [Astrocystis sublimbata]
MFVQIRYQKPLPLDPPFVGRPSPKAGKPLSSLISAAAAATTTTTTTTISSPRRTNSDLHLWPLGPEAHRMNQQSLNKVWYFSSISIQVFLYLFRVPFVYISLSHCMAFLAIVLAYPLAFVDLYTANATTGSPSTSR